MGAVFRRIARSMKNSTKKPSPDATENYPTAGAWRRIAAAIYDGFLLFAVLFVASLIPTLIVSRDALGASPGTNSVVHELNTPLQGWPYTIYLLAITVAFYGWFWRKTGQTLGMQAWRLKLESNDGQRVGWTQVLRRLPVAAAAFFMGGLGYWWIWLDREGRSWQDIASNTRVLQLPKQKK